MRLIKILLVFLFILIIVGSFFSAYKDITSTSNIRTTEELKNTGYAVVGIQVADPNKNNGGANPS